MSNYGVVHTKKAYRPRSITEARLAMSASENDIFDILLTYINKDDDVDSNLFYELNISDFKKEFSFAYDKNAYSKIRNAAIKLSDKSIEILDENNNFIKFCLFQTVRWNENSKKVEVELGNYIKKLLVQEKYKSATFYRVKYTLPMDSQYSKRLYIMFREWLKTGIRYDNVDMLRDKLQVPESYNYSRFKTCVIEVALKEINETTDIFVSYTEKKQAVRGGMKVIGLIFDIKKKECVTDQIESDGGQMILDYLANKGIHDLTPGQAAVIYRTAAKGKLTDRQIKNRINLVLQKDSIQNLTGYLIFAMSEKFHTPKEVTAAFCRFTGRSYSGEWFQLLEKKMLCPERMTRDELSRFEELSRQANNS